MKTVGGIEHLGTVLFPNHAAQGATLQTYLQGKNESGEMCQSSTTAFYEIVSS